MAKLLKRARYRGESEKHGSSEEIPVGGKVFIETLRRNIWKIRALPAHTSSDIFKKWDFFASVLISLPSTRKRRFRAPNSRLSKTVQGEYFFKPLAYRFVWTSNTMLSYTRQTMLSKGRYYHSAGQQVTRNLVTRLSFLKMEKK